VTANQLITANVAYTAAGTFNAENGLTGNVDFAGHAGTFNLALGQTITGNVDSIGSSNGHLNLTNGRVTGTVGTINPLSSVTFYAGASSLGAAARAINFTVADAGAIVTASGLMTGAVGYTAGGSMEIDAGLIGNVDFAGYAGTLNIGAGQIITGNVDSTGSSNGSLIFLGNTSSVTGIIGATNPLAIVSFNGAGPINVPGTARSALFNVGNSGAVVTAAGAITGNFAYSQPGSFNANNGLTGNIDFAGNNGTFNLAAGKTITGSVDSTGSANGTLNLTNGTVTGAVGSSFPLSSVTFYAGASSLGAAARAVNFNVAGDNTTTVTASGLMTGAVNYTAGGSLTANGGITGNIDFAGHAGTLNLAAGQTITGSVDSTGSANGSLNLTGGTVTGAVGSSFPLSSVTFNAGASSLGAAAKATSFTIAGNNTTAVTATGLMTGAVKYTADSRLTANGGITGSVTTNTNNTGTLLLRGVTGTVTGAIGSATAALKAVGFGTGLGAPVFTLNSTTNATDFTVLSKATVTASGLITGAVTLGGTLTAASGIAGVVTTDSNNTGTLNIAGTVTGSVGASGVALKALNFNAGTYSLSSTSFATNFTVADATAAVTATGLMTGAVGYTAGGSLTASGGITGDVNFAGNNGTFNLALGQTITGNVDSTASSNGTLNLTGGRVTGAVGSSFPLSSVTFNAGASSLGAAARAVNFSLADAAAAVTASGLMTGAVNYTAGGSLTSNGGITGNIDFTGHAGTLNLAAGQTITGNVDSTVSSNGTLVFLGANSSVTGAIGATNPLAMISFNGSGPMTVPGTARSALFNVGNSGAIVTALGLITGAVEYTADGSLTAGGGVTGNIDFAGHAGTFNLALGQTITGSVDSTSSANGTLNLTGGTVTGAVGSSFPLSLVTFNPGASSLGAAARAATFNIASNTAAVTASGLITGAVGYTAGGSLTTTGGISGNIDFANQSGTVNVTGGAIITGNIDSSLGSNGTVNFTNGTLAGGVGIGNIGATNNIALVNINAGGAANIGGNINATTVNFANASSLTMNGPGVFPAGSYNLNAAVTNGANGTLNALVATLNFSDPSIGTIKTINIGAGSTLLPLDADGLNLLGGGKIISFTDNSSRLLVRNTRATNETTNFLANLDPGSNNNGKVEFNCQDASGAMTITGAAFSLGTPAHKLGQLKFSGYGAINLEPTINTVNLKLSTPVITLAAVNANVQLANDSTVTPNITSVIYNADGNITGDAAGTGVVGLDFQSTTGIVNLADNLTVTGSVDSSVAGVNSTVNFAGSATITGPIGASNAITALNFNGGAGKIVNLNAAAKVTNFTIAGIGSVIAGGPITGAVKFTADGRLTASNGITGAVTTSVNNTGTLNLPGTVTGQLGTAALPLKAVNFDTGVTTLNLASFATNFTVADAAAAVTALGLMTGDVGFAADGTLSATSGIAGAVTTSANNAGTLNLAGTVTGTVGSTALALKAIIFNAGTYALNSAANAINFTVADAGAIVTTSGPMTGALNFTAGGKLTANNTITGNVNFAGNNGTLNLALGQTITGNVDSTGSSNGTLNFLGNTSSVTGAIGSTYPLALVSFNGAGAINLPSNAKSALFNVGNASAIVTANQLITANVAYTAAGTFNAENGLTGNVDFAGHAGTFNLALGQTITGNVDSIGSSNGHLNLTNGRVTGTVGTINPLSSVTFYAGASSLGAAARAINFTVADAGAIVTASGLMTGAVGYTAGGSMEIDAGLIGNVDFAGYAGTLNIGAGQIITGNVDSTGSSNGSLIFLGNTSSVTGIIGATNPLAIVSFNGAGPINVPGTARSALFNVGNSGAVVTAAGAITGNVAYSQPGSFNANNGLTGNIDFAGNNGTFNLAAGKTITGSVDSTGSANGTLNLTSGRVTGAVGSSFPLSLITFNAGVSSLGAEARATTFTIADATAAVTASGLMTGAVKYTADGSLTSNGGITGDVDFAGNNGTLTINNGILTGNITSSTGSNGTLNVSNGTINGDIGDATNKIISVNFLIIT
jgi:hypothetical protein